MNFLGHYYTDKQLQNPLFNAGLSLPDLFAIFNRKWRIRHIDAISASSESARELLEGCLKHLETDRAFHQSTFFKVQIKMLKELLVKYQLSKFPFRPFFITHILLELLMDRILMKEFPDLLPQYYSDLREVEQAQMATLQDFLGFGNIEGFWQFFNRFRNDQFLFNYQNFEGFINSLNRTFSRVKQPVFEGASLSAFRELLFEAEIKLAPAVLNIREL